MSPAPLDLFEVIEDVLSRRDRQGLERYSVRQAIVDIFEVADKQKAGVTFSRREIRGILARHGLAHSDPHVNKTITDLIEIDGVLEVAPQELRATSVRGTAWTPVYRLVRKA